MDLLDGSGFWVWGDDSFVPPTPGPTPGGGGGPYPTRVLLRDDIIAEEKLKKQRLIEDDEFIVFLS